MLAVINPATPADFDALRRLCWDYRAHLLNLGGAYVAIMSSFYPADTYAALLSSFEADHAARPGSIKLVCADGVPVGCGMFHALTPDTAEIKRVFVADSARGMGAGRAIMTALIDQCRADGFARIYLDTAKALTGAASLYHTLGFRPRGPYQPVPDIARDYLLFFEMTL